MARKHNKKRNVGIIYELMLRHISNCLIEGNMSGVKKATAILEKRFNNQTELYKEFRIFNAIATSTVKNTEIAAAILTESKAAVGRFDEKKLHKEKSDLIRDINYQIKDASFYYRTIPNYKNYATIQIMLNEWRKGDTSNLKNLVEIEKNVIEWLLCEKQNITIDEERKNLEASDADKLVVKIMTEKINSKYGKLLPRQKEIIKNFALYSGNEDMRENLISYLAECKKNAIASVEEFSLVNENKYLNNKVNSVLERISDLNPEDTTDKSIVKFLTLTNLVSEIGLGE